MQTKTVFNSSNGGHRGMASHGRKGSKSKQGGHKRRGRKDPANEHVLEQPIADSTATVPCPVCHHPVDPKRMHPHMVRFHGAATKRSGHK